MSERPLPTTGLRFARVAGGVDVPRIEQRGHAGKAGGRGSGAVMGARAARVPAAAGGQRQSHGKGKRGTYVNVLVFTTASGAHGSCEAAAHLAKRADSARRPC